MGKSTTLYKRHRFPPEIIQYAVWLYHRFNLSQRDIQDLLAERGNGWLDADGNVWVPTGPGGTAHGGPHWDVQTPGGGYINVYPGGTRR